MEKGKGANVPKSFSIKPVLSHVLSLPKGCRSIRDTIRLKHYSIRTEEAYVRWIKRYILYHGKRHPKDMGIPEIEAFLTHLAVDQKVAASTQNQAVRLSSRRSPQRHPVPVPRGP